MVILSACALCQVFHVGGTHDRLLCSCIFSLRCFDSVCGQFNRPLLYLLAVADFWYSPITRREKPCPEFTSYQWTAKDWSDLRYFYTFPCNDLRFCYFPCALQVTKELGSWKDELEISVRSRKSEIFYLASARTVVLKLLKTVEPLWLTVHVYGTLVTKSECSQNHID